MPPTSRSASSSSNPQGIPVVNNCGMGRGVVAATRFLNANKESLTMPERRKGTRHPYIPELREQLRRGQINRRDFLRTATLLGMSSAAFPAGSGFDDGFEEGATTT